MKQASGLQASLHMPSRLTLKPTVPLQASALELQWALESAEFQGAPQGPPCRLTVRNSDI